MVPRGEETQVMRRQLDKFNGALRCIDGLIGIQ